MIKTPKKHWYLVFAGFYKHPKGGWNDLVGRYTELEAANSALIRMMLNDECEWGQIVDLKTMKMINEKNKLNKMISKKEEV